MLNVKVLQSYRALEIHISGQVDTLNAYVSEY